MVARLYLLVTPSGSLNHQEPCAPFHKRSDGLKLAVTELCARVSNSLSELHERFCPHIAATIKRIKVERRSSVAPPSGTRYVPYKCRPAVGKYARVTHASGR
jgi:hypothetical protein